MVEIRRKSLLCREVWFDEQWQPNGADVILFYHWNSPAETDQSNPIHSLEIDLTAPEANIWSGFAASTRNQINRAKREGLVFGFWPQPDASTLDCFLSFRGKFMGERGFDTEEPEWMRAYCAQGALALTNAALPDGKVLVWHSYYRNQDWACQLNSVSLFAAQEDHEARNTIARANRFLHWMDILEFRKAGARHFDLGGWYSGKSDEKLLHVNSFKEGFGGVKTVRYQSTLVVSTKAKLYFAARNLLKENTNSWHWT